MRDLYSYCTNEFKESVDDCINFSRDEIERKFVKWTYYLEDAITFVKLTYNLYDGLILFYLSDNDEKNMFKTVIISSLCRSIILTLSSILKKSKNNEYEISDYLEYIRKNIIIQPNSKMKGIRMKKYDGVFLSSLDNIADEIKKTFNDNFSTIRNRLYAHSDNIYFNETKLKEIFDKTEFGLIKKIYLKLIGLLNEIWMMFRGKKLSFDIENEKQNYIDILKMFNVKHVDMIVDYFYENDSDD